MSTILRYQINFLNRAAFCIDRKPLVCPARSQGASTLGWGGSGSQPAPYPPQPKKEIVKNIFTPTQIKGYDQLDTIFKLNGELKNSIGQARKNTTKGL